MHFQAGEWALEFRDGDLWHIRIAGMEALERVYFALRDERWGTVPFRISGLHQEADADGFRLSFDALHDSGEIRFRWHGSIEGSAAGWIRYAVSGEALSAFRKNRIGVWLHHPLSLAGREFLALHTDGRQEKAAFPKLISPHQPVLDLRSLRYPLAPGREVEIVFSGDVWEMEDQRNWSDANFKTYPTPLALPFPVTLTPGARIEQSIELRLRLSGPSRSLPTGLILDELPPLPVYVQRLHRLRISHLRVEDPARLAEASHGNLPVELARTLGNDPERQLAALDTSSIPLARVIVYRAGEPVAGPHWIKKVRVRFPGIAVLPGANGHFAELNRNRTSDFSAGAAFGLHPQVHAFDAESIMANLAAHDAMVETARSFIGEAPLILSPVRFAPPGVRDPRLDTGLGAAWTRAVLANFARLGVASVTIHTLSEVFQSALLEKLFAGGEPEA
jgi:hypothetical protein